MKKFIAAGLCAVAFSSMPAMADIIVNLPQNSGINQLMTSHAPILKLANAKSRAEKGYTEETVAVKNGTATIAVDGTEGGSQYIIVLNENDNVKLFASPGDNIVVDITSMAPFAYTLSGTELIDGMNEIEALTLPIIEKQRAMMAAGQPSEEQMDELYNDYVATIKEYIDENVNSQKAVYAVLNLSGEDYLQAFDRLSERAKTSILYPLAQNQYDRVKINVEKERKQAEMQSGNITAPDFTLKNPEGKEVSLADFRGKWVILDFWGSWCIWCIKGFPELKEAYEKYKDELEIVGVDCNESEDAWKAGIKKYELPWVNVYCPEGNTITDQYGVQGFPTKAIIDPEGKIRNITTGHNPDFFNILTKLMGK